MIWKMIYRKWKRDMWYPFITVIVIALSASLVWVTDAIENEVADSWSSQSSGIDLVIGAKGSPLQLVLANVFHADAPVGNISWNEAETALAKLPIAVKVPLAYGDTHKGYRILGTNSLFFELYETKLSQGNYPTKPYEVVIGSRVQEATGLEVGDYFLGSHGEVQGGHHHDHEYTVVGVLDESNSVADQLLICQLSTVWAEHHQHGDEREITAYLITVKQAMAKLTLPRRINERTNFQAAVPAIEVNKLLSLFGDVLGLFKAIGWLIGGVAVILVFFVLLQSAKDRKADLIALSMHGAPSNLSLWLLLVEGVLVASFGLLIGALVSLLMIQVIASYHVMLQSIHLANWNGYFIASILGAAILAAIVSWWRTKRWNLSHELKQTWS